MELHWLAFLVIAILISNSAQGAYDTTYAVYTFDNYIVDPYNIVQAQDDFDNDNYERYLPIGYNGRSKGDQQALKDRKRYRKLKNEENEARKLKSLIMSLNRILNNKEIEEDD